MAFEIIWLPKAEERFDEIITYLIQEWSEKVVEQFVERTNEVLLLISQNPELYRKSSKKDIREAVLTKHNLLLYRIKEDKIEVVTFFDTHRSPKRKFR